MSGSYLAPEEGFHVGDLEGTCTRQVARNENSFVWDLARGTDPISQLSEIHADELKCQY